MMLGHGGTSPRLLLWDSITRTAKGAYAPLLNVDHECSDKAEDHRGFQEKLRCHSGVRRLLEEDARHFEVDEDPGPFYQTPRTVSTLVAHPRQPSSLVCPALNECAGSNAQVVVGTDGVLSASVAGSLCCLHVRLQGLQLLQRYFIAVDVQLDSERSDQSGSEIASYFVPKPNLLDGLGWTHSPLTLDLATVIRERVQRASLPTHAVRQWDIGYRVTARILPLADDCWPSGEEPVLILLKEGSLQELILGKGMSRPETFPPEVQHLTCPQSSLWEAGALHLPLSSFSPPMRCDGQPFKPAQSLSQAFSWDLIRDVQAALAYCQQSTLRAQPTTAFANPCFGSSTAPHDSVAPRGHAVFYRDLDAEASLRLQHLEMQRASSEGPSQERRWCSGDEDKLLHFRAAGDSSEKWADKSNSFKTSFKF